MPDLKELLERVKGATGPDRDLNAVLLRHFGWTTSGWDLLDPAGERVLTVPDLVGSLDAALALVERASPLKGPVELTIAGSAQACLNSDDPCGLQVQALGHELSALQAQSQRVEG